MRITPRVCTSVLSFRTEIIGDIRKLVRIKNPPKIAVPGTLMALPTWEQPCISKINAENCVNEQYY